MSQVIQAGCTRAGRWCLWGVFLCMLSARLVASPPNVVMFVLDDVGQTDIGAFGNPVVQTPAIDALAADGMRFDNAFLTTSSCSPSRASILTGQYPTVTGAPGLADALPASVVSLPGLLRQAGYYTASVGKWHLGEAFKSHFDKVVEDSDDSGASEWLPELQRRPRDKPFFFWFASKDAHDPFDWHAPLRHQDPRTVPVPPWARDDAFTHWVMAQYYNEIARADANIGSVVNSLRREGVLDNTVLIVLSDNGSQIGGAKTTLYDEGLKTPLVIRWPAAVMPGVANQQLVSTVDLLPTVIALIGIAADYRGSGVSMQHTFQDAQQPLRADVYAERNRHGRPYFERMLRNERYLYKRNYLGMRLCNPQGDRLWDPDPPRRQEGHEALYDLQQDPLALKDVSRDRDYSDEMQTFRARMNLIMHDNGDKPPPLVMEQCLPRPWHERILLPRPPSSG